MRKDGRILFASMKGGVGKSTAAVEVASALAVDGYKVVLVDLDFRSRSLDLMLGVSDDVVFTISDFAKKRCDIENVMIAVAPENIAGELYLVPACSEEEFEGDDPNVYETLPEVLKGIEESSCADFVICDTGADTRIPRIVADGYAALAVIVSEQSRTSIRASETTAEKMSASAGIRDVRLLINNFDIEAARSGDRAGILEMIDDCSAKCIGVIPHDPSIAIRQDNGGTWLDRSPVSMAAANIARRICGIQTPLFSGMKRERRRVTL